MPPKKRFSAFEDLSTSASEKAKIQSTAGIESPANVPAVERIERLTPTQMMPDRFQPLVRRSKLQLLCASDGLLVSLKQKPEPQAVLDPQRFMFDS